MKRQLTVLLILTTMPVSMALARPYAGLSGLAAAADSAITAGTNPAGMSRFEEKAMHGELLVFRSESQWEGQLGDGLQVETEDSSTTVVPSGYLVKPLNEKYTFGFTVLGMGFSDDLGDWPGKYFIETYESMNVSAFPSVAYKVNDKFSIAGSLQITYSSYDQERRIANIFDPDYGSGSASLEADGFELGFGVSMLYQFSDQTRAGLTYLSELDPSLEGEVKFRGLGPNTEMVLDKAGFVGADVEVTSRQPQSVMAGVYHEFENDHAFTVDIVWSDFSRFKLSEFYFDGEALAENEAEYNDIYAISGSYSWPVKERWMLGVAGMYVDDMIEDDNRTMTLRLDSLWSLGVAAQWHWKDDRFVKASFSYIGMGDAPVDTPSIPGIGAAIGEYTNRDIFMFRIGVSSGDI